jgi:5-methyltetrahydrofolate--homocysteine methyltransferase
MNPLHEEVKTLVMAADVLVGNDENCSAWIRANRDPNEVNAERSARNSRGRRRTE